MSVHVECGLAGLAGTNVQPLEIGGSLQWSETLTGANATTAQAAPPAPNGDSVVVFTVTGEADCWIAIAASPDASVAALRRRIRAGVTRTFRAPAGARLNMRTA